MSLRQLCLVFALCASGNKMRAQSGDRIRLLPFLTRPDSTNAWPECSGHCRFRYEFQLSGRQPGRYALAGVEDSATRLFYDDGPGWKLLDRVTEESSLAFGDDQAPMIPAYTVQDINFDGYPDLTAWISSNINGNQWTKLYVYDSVRQRLQLLSNTAEGSDIWDGPRFFRADSVRCERFSGVFGLQFESLYRWDGLRLLPVSKVELDFRSANPLTGKGARRRWYAGRGARWRLLRSRAVRGDE
jgi:hypothetical protein